MPDIAGLVRATLQTKPANLDASEFSVTDAAPLAFVPATGWLDLASQLEAPQTAWKLGSDTGLF